MERQQPDWEKRLINFLNKEKNYEYGIFQRGIDSNKLIKFISQEIQRAKKEGKKEGMQASIKELKKSMSYIVSPLKINEEIK